MGYTSQVVIAVSARKANAFLRVLKKHGFADEVRQNKAGDVLLVTGGKWYQGYEDVDAVMSFLAELDDSDYRYARVGEELGDIDSDGSLEAFDINVQTVINSDDCPGRPRWPADIELAEACENGKEE